MNTLKSLSLLVVCVVAGVVLFTLRGDNAVVGLVYEFNVNKYTNDSAFINLGSVHADSNFTFYIEREKGGENTWVVKEAVDLTCKTSDVSVTINGRPGAKIKVDCTAGDIVGKNAAKLTLYDNTEKSRLLKFSFDVGQPLVL